MQYIAANITHERTLSTQTVCEPDALLIIHINTLRMHNTTIGIDVAKDTFVAADMHDRTRTFPNTEAGIRKCISWSGAPPATTVGLEAMGVYHTSLCLTLQSYGYQPVIINPLVVKRYAELSVRKTKTDAKDAQVIRRATSSGEGYPFVDTPETIALRALIAERRGLVATKQTLKGRLHAHVLRQNAVGMPLADTISPVLWSVHEQIKGIDTQLSAYASDTQALLRSIPGVGLVAAATLVALVGDISRFPNRDALVAFVCIDPRVHDSGTSVHGKRYINKRGNKTLRHILYQCAFVAVRYDAEFARYYRKKKAEGKHHVAIITALERKLCARIFAVWKRGTPFVSTD